MKIREILELTKEKKFGTIAKEYLEIGEKPATKAFKNSGAYFSNSAPKGWHFKGPEENLDKSIYDFPTDKIVAVANVTTKDENNIKTKDVNNKESKEVNNKTTEEETNERKRASFDLDKKLLKQLKFIALEEERNIYELVEEALRDYVTKKSQK